MKKLRIISAVLLIVSLLTLTGCGKTARTKVYDFGNGLTMTLPDDMEEQKIDIHYASYFTDGVLLVIDRYTFEEFEAFGRDAKEMSIEDYNALIEASFAGKEGFTDNKNGDMYITYENKVADIDYFYYCTSRKGSDSFWFITFACKMKEKDKYLPEFEKWNADIDAK